MKASQGILIGVVLIAVGAAVVIFYLQYQDKWEKDKAFQEMVEAGFDALDEPGGVPGADQAIQQGLRAREMDPQGKEPLILLGRAYLEKKMYTEAAHVLEQGLSDIDDLDYYPELNYYLGLVYSRMFEDLDQDEIWQKAMTCFSESASSSYHRSDAYFGIGALYFSRYQENSSPYLKEKVTFNFQRCIDIEADQDGEMEMVSETICPLCRAPFKAKMENESFTQLMEALTRKE